MKTYRIYLVALVAFSIAGCGGGGEEAEEHAKAASGGGHKVAPKAAEVEAAGDLTLGSEKKETPKREAEFIPVFADAGARDPFAPPVEMPEIEVEPEPEPVKPQLKLPNMKLVGFVKVDNERAMLKFGEELVLVGAGDKVSGVEILEVKSPDLKVKFGEDRIAMNLFDNGNGDRATNQGRRKLAVTRSSDSAAATPPVNVRPSNPRLQVPSLPPTAGGDDERGGGIPGLPSGDGRPALPGFPSMRDT